MSVVRRSRSLLRRSRDRVLAPYLGAITGVRTDENVIAITFDDGPNPAATPALLALFDRHSAKATHFMVGNLVERWPELVEDVLRHGHSVASHSYDHPSLVRLDASHRAEQLKRGHDALGSNAGPFFRPPYGHFDLPTAWSIRQAGMTPVTWTHHCLDWEVHDTDDSAHATHLVRRTALAESIAANTEKPILHGDNGATLKATTVLAMLHWLGVKPSYSRPRVSDDNAYAEALFKTAKYRPEFPTKGFETLEAARTWASEFVHWYNVEHRHSGIQYVSPAQRHAGQDKAILAARHALYQQARERNPIRWTTRTRNWQPIGAVTLNPERDAVVAAEQKDANEMKMVA